MITWFKEITDFLKTFFPIQLFLLHIRRSHALIIFWLILFLLTNRILGVTYGLPYLFLTPEYLGEVSFWAYCLVGITSGLFVMAFHINSYIYYSYRYTFLATLNRPLWKFCLNNSVIPILFYALYTFQIYHTLLDEGVNWLEALLNIGGLLLGSIFTISFSFTYFFGTLRTLELPNKEGKERNPLKPLKILIKKDNEVSEKVLESHSSKVNHYLKNPFTIKLARKASHYSKEVLMETIQQHHFSASIYFVILILLVIGLNFSAITIPAGASLFLIFSLYLMITGALYSRLKTWTVSVGIMFLLILNYLSGLNQFKGMNYAFGMDYKTEKAQYSYEELDRLTSDSIVSMDRKLRLDALNNWRSKFPENVRPRMVVLNVSGGGLRSSLWTMKVMQQLDSILDNQLMDQTHLITGSSGGMLGAAYYREIKYQDDNRIVSAEYLDNISKDVLNPIASTLAVNDLFFRFKKVNYEGVEYTFDRGYAFDQKFNENTKQLLNRNFGYYKKPEFNSEIPTMILAPTIIGDGRRLLMSTQGLSFLAFEPSYHTLNPGKNYDAVEFSKLFEKQGASNLSFVTALRLSASFPYITPLVGLPSSPSMELIDAGVRDNEGLEIALRYLYEFKDWIAENTKGVIVIQIKANRPNEIPIMNIRRTKFEKAILPINGVIQSFNNLQIYNKSILTNLNKESIGFPLDITRFSLFEKEDAVSLSWHLTEKEKGQILQIINNAENQKQLKWVEKVLTNPDTVIN